MTSPVQRGMGAKGVVVAACQVHHRDSALGTTKFDAGCGVGDSGAGCGTAAMGTGVVAIAQRGLSRDTPVLHNSSQEGQMRDIGVLPLPGRCLVPTIPNRVRTGDVIWDELRGRRHVTEVRDELVRVFLRFSDDNLGGWYLPSEMVPVETWH